MLGALQRGRGVAAGDRGAAVRARAPALGGRGASKLIGGSSKMFFFFEDGRGCSKMVGGFLVLEEPPRHL